MIDYVSLGFAVTQDGIYYFGRPGEDRRSPLFFYGFSSGESRLLTRIEGLWREELTVSPDHKTFLYTPSLLQGQDLMLIENFR